MTKVITIDLTAIDAEAGQHWLSIEQRTAGKREQIRQAVKAKHRKQSRPNPVIDTKPTLKDDDQ